MLTLASKTFIAWVLLAASWVIALAFTAISPLAASISWFAIAILPSKLDSAAKALSFSATILESNPATAWVLSWTSLAIAWALTSIACALLSALPSTPSILTPKSNSTWVALWTSACKSSCSAFLPSSSFIKASAFYIYS